MTLPEARTRAERVRDTKHLLETSIDLLVATAGVDEQGGARPWLVPLSLAWLDERVVIAVEESSRTAKNLAQAPTARLSIGHTRDVVMIDAVAERTEPVLESSLGEPYAARSDWDPRASGGESYRFVVLRPVRIQAWREVNELAGRLLMRDGAWLE